VTATDGAHTNRVAVSWTAAAGASHYRVHRTVAGSGVTNDVSGGWIAGTSLDDSTVLPGKTNFYFAQAAVDGAGNRFSALGTGDMGWRALAAPEGVTASQGVSANGVTVNWQAVQGAGAYRVSRATTLAGAKTDLGTWANATAYGDSALAVGATNYYFVRAAVNLAGVWPSAYSAVATGWWQLACPTRVAASDGQYTNRVAVTWTNVAGATHYQVYTGAVSGGSVGPASLWITTTNYDHTTGPAGVSLYYSVRAATSSSGANAGGYSTEDEGWRGLVGPPVAATEGTYTNRVAVSWAGIAGASHYRVHRTVAGSGVTNDVSGGWIAGTSLDDSTVLPGKTNFYFAQAAVDGAGNRFSALGTGDMGWRALAAPEGVTASQGVSANGVTVNWQAVQGAGAYRVSRATTLAGAKTDLGTWANATAYGDSALAVGATNYYFVRAAVNLAGVWPSAYSAVATGWWQLACPTRVAASDGQYTNRVAVTWTNVAGATHYQVYTGAVSGGSVGPASLWITTTNYDHTTGPAGVSLYYSVRAATSSSGANAGGYSTEDEGWRGLVGPPVAATEGTYTNRVAVSWAGIAGASHYRVHRTAAGSGVTNDVSPWIAGTSLDDSTVLPGVTNYYFAQAAIDGSGGRASALGTGDMGWRALAAPEGVTASKGTFTNQVQIAWDPAQGAGAYRVSRATTLTGAKTVLGTWANATTYADTATAVGVTNYYFVQAAVNKAGVWPSDYSAADFGWRGKPQAIALSTTNLSVVCTQGQNAASQQFDVWNAGEGTMGYSLSANQTWLSLDTLTGDSAGEHDPIRVDFPTSGLETGRHSAAITVAAEGATNSPRRVWVSVDVRPKPPVLAVSASEISVVSTQGQNAAAQTFEVWNAGGGSMAYSLAADKVWISLDPTNGISTGGHDPIQVSFPAAGLGTGLFEASITVTALEATNTSHAIAVHLEVLPPPANLVLSRTNIAFVCTQNQEVASQTFEICNTGGGSMTYTLTPNQPWLSLIPPSGESSGEPDPIEVRCNSLGMETGSHPAAITVIAPRATNAQQDIGVSLIVLPPLPVIWLSPTNLAPVCAVGENAREDSFQVANVGGRTLSYALSDDATWLSIDPLSGSSTGMTNTIRVTYATTNLTIGTTNATITVTADGATNGPQTIPVTLTVRPPNRVIWLEGELDFGDVTVGSNAVAHLTIHNDGIDPLSVAGITNAPGFSGDCATQIVARGSVDVPITFSPTEVRAYSGVLKVVSDATEGADTMPETGTGVAPAGALADALDNDSLDFVGGGVAPWYGQTGASHDGQDAARSGTVGANQESWFETTVQGAGTLSFWWQLVSGGADKLEFWVDGVARREISGATDWERVSWILGVGSHSVRWRYVKDPSGDDPGDMALVDQVVFVPAGAAPSVTNVRASQRAGTKLVDVCYDITSGANQVFVTVQVSTNAGATYDLTATSLTGDVGGGVTPDTGRRIVWDAGADWDGRYSPAVRFRVSASDWSVPPGFVLIPAGSFQMGDALDGISDAPAHTVYTSAFYMQSNETTKAQWDQVRSWGLTNGFTDLPTCGGKAPDHPVQYVTWYDAVKWCNARSKKEGLTPCYTVGGAVYRTGAGDPDCNWGSDGYRLPTEAEWEKAARGGSSGRRFPWADVDTITHSRANYASSTSYGYDVNPYSGFHPTFMIGDVPYTSPAGYFAPNGYGLYDMAGNVFEWCWDRFSSTYYSNSPSSDPVGPTSGTDRVRRGCDWSNGANNCRVADRSYSNAGGTSTSDGFRTVRKAGPPDFILIPAGNFQMGDINNEGSASERPVHTVYVSEFYMQGTEVTKAQWDDVRNWASTNNYADLGVGSGKALDHPVQQVTWHDAVKWCNARSEKENLLPCYHTTSAKTTVYRTGTVDVASGAVDWGANGYRLPTEAEWEKAARGGAAGHRFPWHDTETITHDRANYYSYDGFPYDVSLTSGFHPDYKGGDKPYTSPVGAFADNVYGLHDMEGNVVEWCWDWYDVGYYGGLVSPDPTGPSSGTYRVMRGCSWDGTANYCRVAARSYLEPVNKNYNDGFRPARRSLGTVAGESNTLSVDTRGVGLLPSSGDYDGDGCPNGHEYAAGTDPRDARSRFRIGGCSAAPNVGGTGVICTVSWAAMGGRLYRVERSFDLKQWDVVADNVGPVPSLNTVTDEIVPKPTKVFYRIVVK